jgi:hypothetical protein
MWALPDLPLANKPHVADFAPPGNGGGKTDVMGMKGDEIENPRVIPLGYMLKQVATAPEWMKAPQVERVFSVSNCVSRNFADYIPLWRHNGWWLFDSPAALHAVAADMNADVAGLTLFYYEAFEREYHEDDKTWGAIAPERDMPVNVEVPASKRLQGYDVATFRFANAPECSPLSCNALAAEIATNPLCLLDSVERARALLESGAFNASEPGPFRIVAVYTLD